jgi:hypothetical protein
MSGSSGISNSLHVAPALWQLEQLRGVRARAET